MSLQHIHNACSLDEDLKKILNLKSNKNLTCFFTKIVEMADIGLGFIFWGDEGNQYNCTNAKYFNATE